MNSEVLSALADLQAEAVNDPRLPAERGPGKYMSAKDVERAVAMATRHGFEPLGVGSTRLVVAADAALPGSVAKVAFGAAGGIFNLQEATAWLWVKDTFRDHLAPCLAITPELVLLQERQEVLGPTLIESKRRDTLQERTELLERYRTEIDETYRGLGFEPREIYRLDNCGFRDGRLVLLDYCERWHPFDLAWAWVLHRLADGPVKLDHVAFLIALGKGSWPSWPLAPSVADLATRAGIRPESLCPCGSGEPMGDCDPAVCGMWQEARLWMAHRSDVANTSPLAVAGRPEPGAEHVQGEPNQRRAA